MHNDSEFNNPLTLSQHMSTLPATHSSSSSSLLAEMRTEKQRYNTHCCQK